MPGTVYSITAVDTGADTLTITAHGLVTGDGFAAIYTDASGTLPSPLAAATDYWAIRVDANTIKLASSSANAMLGTAINLTSTGSGTLQLLRGLPYRRPRIAIPGQQVFSADLNDVWLSLVALWNKLTGQTGSSPWVFTTLEVDGPVSVADTFGVAGATALSTLSVSGLSTIAAVDFAAQVRLASTISPTAITSTSQINDWAPTGLGTANQIRQVVTNSGGANVPISGITGGVAGRVIVLHALGTLAGDTITLKHENASSAAANRFSLASGADLVIPQYGTATLVYDGTSSRWRVCGKNF